MDLKIYLGHEHVLSMSKDEALSFSKKLENAASRLSSSSKAVLFFEKITINRDELKTDFPAKLRVVVV